jgi:hypothetical protein
MCYSKFLICFFTFFLPLSQGFSQEKSPVLVAETPILISAKKIWGTAKHSAFTDLIRFNQRWYCVFRESDEHVGGNNGVIRLIESVDGDTWKSAAVFSEKGIDLRDPKLSVTPDNRLMLLFGGTQYSENGEYITRQPRVAFSKDGEHWTDSTKILEPHEWLWRVTWHDGKAYGVSYRSSHLDNEGKDWIATLFVSSDGVTFKKITQFNVSGYPSEATLRFLESGKMVALLRRGSNAWIGVSEAPYNDWTWKDSGAHLGGPNFLILPDHSMWASGRSVEKDSNGNIIEKTTLSKMTLEKLERLLDLPSGGDDTSYPGMVYCDDGILWISYYSSHEGDHTAIYLAKVKLAK